LGSSPTGVQWAGPSCSPDRPASAKTTWSMRGSPPNPRSGTETSRRRLPRCFYYAVEEDPAFLKHKFIYPNEAEAVDTVVEFLRPMLSKGRARKYVTNKNGEGTNAFQELEVEGPITGVIPTTRNKLNDELQTRMLVAELEHYEGRIREHTRALSQQTSLNRKTAVADQQLPQRWQSALRSLTGVRQVGAEFADHPEFALDNDELDHGARLWQNLLALMYVNAWAEQRNREIRELEDGTKAVVATAEDYKAAYELLDVVGRRSIVNLGDTHRRIVRAVYELRQDADSFKEAGFSTRQIAERAGGMSKGTVSKHKTYLTKSLGLLYETDDGRLNISEAADPSWWDTGEVMKGFPAPEQVAGWGIPPLHTENGGNAETLEQKRDAYAEKPVSDPGNTPETAETVSHQGGPEKPINKSGRANGRDRQHEEAVLEILRRKLGGSAHPDKWREKALEHGMSEKVFKKAMTALDRSGRVDYHFGSNHTEAYYFLPDERPSSPADAAPAEKVACTHPQKHRVQGNNGMEGCSKCGQYL
jgi:hypothetical protein